MPMTKNSYRPRLVDCQVCDMLKAVGAVCIEGPKWCGKTWVAFNHAESAIMIGDPSGNFQNRKLVELDLSRAFKGKEPHLIDEWQDVPGIWDAVKSTVDESNAPGRFILTGSSTPRPGTTRHSGAGRIGRIRMRTMSLFESGDSDGSVSLRSLFAQTEPSTDLCKVDLEHLVDLVVRGGWPGNLGKDLKSAALANRAYLMALIEEASILDSHSHDKNKIKMVLRSLARNESTMASLNTLVSDAEECINSEGRPIGSKNGKETFEMMIDSYETVSQKSVSKYLAILDRLFLINNQPSFEINLRSSARVGKKPKRHLADPSLAVAAMNFTSAQLLNDLRTFGFLFEALCERDLEIYAAAMYGTLYHYRDGRGREIDAVVELPDGRWGAFEIKLGVNQIDEAAQHLVQMDELFGQEGVRRPEFLCVICGMAAAAYQRPEDGVYVVPLTRMRD